MQRNRIAMLGGFTAAVIVFSLLAFGAAVLSARATMYCRGGLGTGAGVGLQAIAIFALVVCTSPILAFTSARASLKRGFSVVARAAVVASSAFVFPSVVVFLMAVAQASLEAPLSCVNALLASGAAPATIVTVRPSGATLWRPRDEQKPGWAHSPDSAFQEACRTSPGAPIFIVTYLPWAPVRAQLDACPATVFFLAPATH